MRKQRVSCFLDTTGRSCFISEYEGITLSSAVVSDDAYSS